MTISKKIWTYILGIVFVTYLGAYVYLKTMQHERFKSVRLDENYKFGFPQKFEELNFSTKNGGKINALLFKAGKPKGVVCFWKGNGGNLKNWGNEAGRYLAYDYDVIITDYRQHGKSSGDISFENFHSDAQAVYDHLKSKYAENQIVIAGYSLGTSIATHLARNNNPLKVILIEPKEKFGDKYLDALFFPLPAIYESPFRSDLDIPEIKSPVVIIAGTKSGLYQDALRLQKKLSRKDTMYVIEGATHQTILSNPDLDKVLKKILTDQLN